MLRTGARQLLAAGEATPGRGASRLCSIFQDLVVVSTLLLMFHIAMQLIDNHATTEAKKTDERVQAAPEKSTPQ